MPTFESAMVLLRKTKNYQEENYDKFKIYTTLFKDT